jgi:hypothetical protein
VSLGRNSYPEHFAGFAKCRRLRHPLAEAEPAPSAGLGRAWAGAHWGFYLGVSEKDDYVIRLDYIA